MTSQNIVDPLASTADGPLDDPLQEALRLISLADRQGLQLRLMGGLAFHARVPEWTARVSREGRDIDLATRSHDRKAVADLLGAAGYLPDKQHNALYGHKQLYFFDPRHSRPVDVLVDRLEMCHSFEFADRLVVDHPTLPLAELLLSKLQVVRINRKDILDALILFARFPLAQDDRGGISVPRITGLTSTNWGWWRTVTENLDTIRRFHEIELKPGELEATTPHPFDPVEQITALRAAIDAAPKSAKWKLRARLGDRAPWYELPEEVEHDRR
ncbi:MAG: hypothetical protein C4343_03495 [Chloroflexota bacterium]